MTTVFDYADLVLKHRTADGALVMGDPGGPEPRVVPYFANYAALGLLNVCEWVTDKAKVARYVDGVRRWILWYMDRAEPAGGAISDYRFQSGSNTRLSHRGAGSTADPDTAWSRSR